MKAFNYLMHEHTQKNMYDDHMWFSVAKRPNKSNFTRVQRLCCCMALLFLSMVVNAMWFGKDEESSYPSLKIGPVELSYFTFYVSIAGSLIVLPPTLLIIEIFRRSKQRMVQKDETLAVLVEDPFLAAGYTKHPRQPLPDTVPTHNHQKAKKKTRRLPWWFIIVGYILVFATVSLCGIMCIFYSLEWGKQKANEWLLAMFLGFFQSLLIIQPVKVNTNTNNTTCQDKIQVLII